METNDECVKREGEEADLAKLQYMVWCALVQCLDKASIYFIRGHKPNGTAAWTALTKLHKSTERPRVQSLMTQLTGLKMTSGEMVTDYLTKAEGPKLDLVEAGEVVSDALFTAMILKGLPSDFESVVAVLNFGTAKVLRDEAGLGQFRSNQASLCFQRDVNDTLSLSREEASKVLQVWKVGAPS